VRITERIPRELPPTAGLPLVWRDFAPWRRTETLEDSIARLLGVPTVQVECSGTAALVVALEALKQRSSRRVVVIPAYTCPLVAFAIARAGLQARVCDTAQDRFDLDPRALLEACDRETLCVVPTHLGGAVADLGPVLEIAEKRGALVVEDAAQALGASWTGRPVGTVGDVGFFSLACGKGLSIFQGGLLVARDAEMREDLARASRRIVGPGLAIEALRVVQLAGFAMAYNPAALRWVYGFPLRRHLRRGDPARAVGDVVFGRIPLHRVGRLRRHVGASAASRLGAWLRDCRDRGVERARRISSIPDLEIVGDAAAGVGTQPFFMVLFRSAAAAARALDELWRAGLGVTRLFTADLGGYAYLERVIPRASTPNARSFAARMITISNSPWVTDEHFDRILRSLARAARGVA
jgi:dTDP-4-amino-4,6-dideoxygalactose transaminase